jgi:hypothetical protein
MLLNSTVEKNAANCSCRLELFVTPNLLRRGHTDFQDSSDKLTARIHFGMAVTNLGIKLFLIFDKLFR